MLVVKRRMCTIKQFGKKDNVCQRPQTSHNFLKIRTREMLLKAFSMLISIIAQSGSRSRRVRTPKGMASQPPRVDTSK
jgi:hypothetical protein